MANPQETNSRQSRRPTYTSNGRIYACDGRKVVVLDTDNKEMQVDDERDMFMVRYEVNRVTVIKDLKSRVEGLYVTVGHVNRTDRTVRNDG